MEKVLITGSSGYLGACFYHELSKNKNVYPLKGRLEEIKPDSLDYDTVIHCAGALRYRKGQHTKSNVEGTIKLIRGMAKPATFIYISSKSVYGTNREGDFSEETAHNPNDDYGITKYQGELAVLESNLPYLIIRPSTLIGLGYNNLGPAFPSFAMHQLYNRRDINLFTPDLLHEYLYVWDLVYVVIKLLEDRKNRNSIFNVSGKRRSLHALINTMSAYFNKKGIVPGNVIKVHKKPPKNFYLDTTKLEKALGKIDYTSDEIVIERMGDYLISR